MKIKLHGNITKKVVASIGEWDPITYNHLNIFNFLIQIAPEKNLDSCIILLHPRPIDFIMERKFSIYYNSIQAIISRMLLLGVNGVLECCFENKNDAESNAKNFIPKILKHIKLKYLFLGINQTIGQRENGNQTTIKKIGKKFNFSLKILPESLFQAKYNKYTRHNVLSQLISGCYSFNKKQIPFPPTFYIKQINQLRVNYKNGMYQVCLKNKLNDKKGIRKEILFNRNKFHISEVDYKNNLLEWLIIERGPP